MKIKLDQLDNTPLTLQQCQNVISNTNEMLYEMIELEVIDDIDDQLKTLIHYLSLVLDKLETLNEDDATN